jgi:hypothetical protein
MSDRKTMFHGNKEDYIFCVVPSDHCKEFEKLGFVGTVDDLPAKKKRVAKKDE